MSNDRWRCPKCGKKQPNTLRCTGCGHNNANRRDKATDPADAESMTDNSIQMFLHCGKCLQDFKDDAPGTKGESPSSYAQLEIGWTLLGIQVWCRRHECNVVHVDFEGEKHPAA